MKVFVLHTGDYEQRSIHSIHSNREEAKAVWLRVSQEYRKPADIEEHELDEAMCLECGYRKDLHVPSSLAFSHEFRCADSAAT